LTVLAKQPGYINCPRSKTRPTVLSTRNICGALLGN